MISGKEKRADHDYWDRQAGKYDRLSMKVYAEAYRLSIQKVLEAVTPDDHVLEIGCGTGIVTEGVAPHVQRILATDISPKMIAEARKKFAAVSEDNVEFRVSGGEALDTPDAQFDVVMIFNTLYLVRDPEALLRESLRLLKPGGRLVTATDCLGEPVPLLWRIFLHARTLLIRLRVLPFMHRFTRERLRTLFERNGFRIVETENLHSAPVNYFIRAEKI